MYSVSEVKPIKVATPPRPRIIDVSSRAKFQTFVPKGASFKLGLTSSSKLSAITSILGMFGEFNSIVIAAGKDSYSTVDIEVMLI